MHVMIDLCVVPLGVGVSVSKYIAECEKILNEAGLETHLHAYGTNVAGGLGGRFYRRSTVSRTSA